MVNLYTIKILIISEAYKRTGFLRKLNYSSLHAAKLTLSYSNSSTTQPLAMPYAVLSAKMLCK
jgi:hypothetical protein